jgi:hypothetical protein
MKTHLKISALALMALLALASCQKEDVTSSDAADAALSSTEASNTFNETDDEASMRMADPGAPTPGGDCAVLTWAQPEGTYPNTLTIDFGDGCEGMHGHVKAGKIVVEMSGERGADGAVHVFTLVDFTVDGRAVEGVRTVSFKGANEYGQPYAIVTVRDASMELEDGSFATLTLDHVRTFVAGSDTEAREDDVFWVTGTESGINPKGEEFSAEILQPIVHKGDCRWPVSGVRSFTCGDHSGSIDLGTGSCDDEATLTRADGSTRTIKLRR